MAKVRSRGNLSTEAKVEAALLATNVTGWVKHPRDVPGMPDFYFPSRRLAVFVDGCFWHMCPTCARNMPKSRREFWRRKLEGNRRRDNRVRRRLWRESFHLLRLWEHELTGHRWVVRLYRALVRLKSKGRDRGAASATRRQGSRATVA